MQEDFEYDALTIRAARRTRTRWYTRLWRSCLGHGCLCCRKRQNFSLYSIGYDPVGQLQRAASVGDVASVERFVSGSGYDINDCDRRGRTSLHYASAHNHPDVVTLLSSIDCININLQDDEGCTPLIKATQRDNVECVSILLFHGADPHIMDFNGDAALHHAVCRGNIAIASKLLEYHVNIDAETQYGLTPYKLALYENQQEMAEFLIQNGAEADSELTPNRLSENPQVPTCTTSTAEDEASTSAVKEDTENSSSRYTILQKQLLYDDKITAMKKKEHAALMKSTMDLNTLGEAMPEYSWRKSRLTVEKKAVGGFLPASHKLDTVPQPSAHADSTSSSQASDRGDNLQASAKIPVQSTTLGHKPSSGDALDPPQKANVHALAANSDCTHSAMNNPSMVFTI